LGMPLPTIAVIFDNKKDQTTHEYLKTITHNILAGTDTDPEIAILRCFTEYTQGYKNAFSNASEFIGKWEKLGLTYESKKDSDITYQLLKNKRTYDIDFLLNTENIVPISSIPNKSNKDNLVELNNCIDEFQKKNIDLWFMDLTHPVLNFPVALVISPKMLIKGRNQKIEGIFSRLTFQKMIIQKESTQKFIKQYIDVPISLNEHLLFNDWYKSEVGIKSTIAKLESHIRHFPMEIEFFFDTFIYELLVYLHIYTENYERAKIYNNLLPDFFKTIPNKNKVHDMMINFARIENYLQYKASLSINSKCNGILKIMNASGVSFNIEEKWMNIGNENSESPFGLCNFICETCEINEDICIWKKVKINDMK